MKISAPQSASIIEIIKVPGVRLSFHDPLWYTVPAPKAFLGAGSARAAHMEVRSPKGRFWCRGSGGRRGTMRLLYRQVKGTQGAETHTSPAVSPQMAVVVPSPTAIERSSSPITSLSRCFFPPPLSCAPICNSPCVAVLCFLAHLPFHQLLSSKVGAKNDPSFPKQIFPAKSVSQTGS